MALFTKQSKMEKLQAVVTTLRKRDELLGVKRSAAQKIFDDAVGRRQELLISGDLDDSARLSKMQTAVEIASAITLRELRGLATLVARGDVPIPRRPESVTAVPAADSPALTQVFCLQPIKWVDDNGTQRQSHKWLDVELPAETAARAL